jgi:hypothetical protein
LTTPYPSGIGKLSSTSKPKFSENPSYRKVHPEKDVERGGLPKKNKIILGLGRNFAEKN